MSYTHQGVARLQRATGAASCSRHSWLLMRDLGTRSLEVLPTRCLCRLLEKASPQRLLGPWQGRRRQGWWKTSRCCCHRLVLLLELQDGESFPPTCCWSTHDGGDSTSLGCCSQSSKRGRSSPLPRGVAAKAPGNEGAASNVVLLLEARNLVVLRNPSRRKNPTPPCCSIGSPLRGGGSP